MSDAPPTDQMLIEWWRKMQDAERRASALSDLAAQDGELL